MTHLDRLAEWVGAHRAELEQAGSVRFTRGAEDVSNPSASLVVAFDHSEVELLLWTTGEGEFNHDPLNDATFEHVEVESSEQFDALLERVLDAVIGSGP